MLCSIMWFISFKKPDSNEWQILQDSIDILRPFYRSDEVLVKVAADDLMRRLGIAYQARELIWEEKRKF
jgi:hypothetical protein